LARVFWTVISASTLADWRWKNCRICAASFGTPGSSRARSSVALPRELSSGFCGWR
jgi:hypothetical protein